MSVGWHKAGLAGVDSHDGAAAQHAWSHARWLVLAGCLIAIPAFYVELLATSTSMLLTARALYGGMAVACAAAVARTACSSHKPARFLDRNAFDVAIACGALVSMIGGANPWSWLEWVLRLAFMAMIALRIVVALRSYFELNRLALLPLACAIVLLLGGAGFYALEPHVHSYAEGLWLAFESSATVGYGDIAPTTPASRVFAVFVVLLGYGMLSLAFAGIAAWLIGKEERRLRREMHRDIKVLHAEIISLHRELEGLRDALAPSRSGPQRGDNAARQIGAG
ncbi:potassium channel family protein [Paraburkholderia sp. CNPSo 3274]|uniref:potassium channel family protein n=1 Tax=Paraburkholderia sp. CNPSo 3274 TaxID=2940932 RepID=UPI0020B710FB|nr:potassium channel family protein [Paraburkholderia sp. CNPSo 3274]MCP3710069.1 potassium channel family protein [Paraburkholderia sp. CNPSo 3274]